MGSWELLAALLLLRLPPEALSGEDGALPLHESSFELGRPSEVVATLTAACDRCLWSRKGREAAALELSVDGRYSQHLVLVQGESPSEYAVSLGALAAGVHRLTIALDRRATAPGIRRATVSSVRIQSTAEGTGEHLALANAPILHARADAAGRFTDLPLLMWYESDPTARGRRIRYSVVFSNEDGGTPPDRLMATWGRVTDIEYVYGVELDAVGRNVEAEYQGRKHEILPFAGRREGTHPLLWVATDNNMMADRGDTTVRYRPAPVAFGLSGVSREAVMDAYPWTYRVMSLEVAREKRVVQNARPGAGSIRSPQHFAYLEACAELENAALSIAVGVGTPGGKLKWHDADGGRAAFRIARSGCFRSAVPLPSRLPPERLAALRFRLYAKPSGDRDRPVATNAVRGRLTRVNRLFLLGRDLLPGRNLFYWPGEAELVAGGEPLELPLRVQAEPTTAQ
jgi:hypothetical protein